MLSSTPKCEISGSGGSDTSGCTGNGSGGGGGGTSGAAGGGNGGTTAAAGGGGGSPKAMPGGGIAIAIGILSVFFCWKFKWGDLQKNKNLCMKFV